MNRERKILSGLLACIAVLCLIAAGALIIRQIQDNVHTQDTLEDFRASAETIKDGVVSPDSLSTSLPPERSDNTPAPTAAPEVTQVPPISSPEPTAEPTPTPEPTPEPVTNPYRDSFLANDDMAAWIQVPGTVIDYPVMWTPENEEYYLYRAFDGSKNQNGCLILDTDSSVDPLTTNLIIHGHNMKSGAMFGSLLKYEQESYYKEHKDIVLYTEDVQRNYEIIAVFRSQVYKKSDQVFKFYKFFQANTPAEFDDFYKNIKELSLYDTGVTAEFGDRFITLSTCTYHVENGRFVVVAKEVEPGDTYLPITQ